MGTKMFQLLTKDYCRKKKKLNKYANTLKYGKTRDLAAKWKKVIATNLHTTHLYIHVHDAY